MFLKETVSEEEAVPEAIIAIQSFGDFLGFNPHLHVLVSDGCFYGQGMFRVAPLFELKHLEEIFRHKVFKMLFSKWEEGYYFFSFCFLNCSRLSKTDAICL